jgi:hypothetical protein
MAGLFTFELHDSGSIIGPLPSIDLSLARALRLLAIATAPSPGSRYQPGSHWASAKYATAIDPRILPSGPQLAIANAGIRDLDPHQKTVLADDIGVALALAAIDSSYGIDGLSDCYALWLSSELLLASGGKHRRMPDFVLLLRKPLGGSKHVLLECKGSTLQTSADSQLTAACKQLANVSSLSGITCTSIPKVAIAAKIRPGSQVELHVSDPPEEFAFPDDFDNKLRASFVALELAALGDIAAAERVRRAFDIPSWSRFSIRSDLLASSEFLGLEQAVMTTAPELKRLSAKMKSVFDLSVAKRQCLIHARLVLRPSKRAVLLKEDPSDATALVQNILTAAVANLDEESPLPDRKGRREVARSPDGSTAELITEILPTGD